MRIQEKWKSERMRTIEQVDRFFTQTVASFMRTTVIYSKTGCLPWGSVGQKPCLRTEHIVNAKKIKSLKWKCFSVKTNKQTLSVVQFDFEIFLIARCYAQINNRYRENVAKWEKKDLRRSYVIVWRRFKFVKWSSFAFKPQSWPPLCNCPSLEFR